MELIGGLSKYSAELHLQLMAFSVIACSEKRSAFTETIMLHRQPVKRAIVERLSFSFNIQAHKKKKYAKMKHRNYFYFLAMKTLFSEIIL